MSRRLFVATCLGGVILAGVLFYASEQDWFRGENGERTVKTDAETRSGSPGEPDTSPPRDSRWLEALGVDESELETVGDVVRPSRDVDFGDVTAGTGNANSPQDHDSPFRFHGSSPLLKGNENAQVAGLFEELENPEGPVAARSTFFAPEPFDRDEYQADPEDYLAKIRPSRVFYPAEPAAGTMPLRPGSSRFHRILQGETAILRVMASADAPVSFHSSDGVGRFENELRTITVAANEDGIAEARYTAGPGTSGINSILVASPVHSQQLKFMVKVDLPK